MAARSNEGTGASGWELDGMGGVFDLLGTVASGTVTALSSGVDLVRRKPLLGAVLAAAVVGGGAGILLADKASRPKALVCVSRVGQWARRRVRRFELPIDMNKAWAAPELLPPLMRLLSNPIVQTYLRRAVVSALSRRFSA
jgi:hypothetical protein